MDSNRIRDLLSVPFNDKCADCQRGDPSFASINLGVILCPACASVHKNLGPSTSQVKSLTSDNWTEEDINAIAIKGNRVGKDRYEQKVPIYYRQLTYRDIDSGPIKGTSLFEQWIRAKYQRQEFTGSSDYAIRSYESGHKEGYLWKRGKDDKRFQRRWFVLDETENTLRYYNSENMQEPKGTYRLDELNITFIPDKLDGNPNAMQITHPYNGQTRSIYVYAETGQEMVEWYTSIRCVKFKRLTNSHPERRPNELCQILTRDFLKEGWLNKSGPRSRDVYRRRWITLDKRKLLYFEDMLDAFPRGEVVIGSQDQNYAVRVGVPPGQRDQGFSFTLKTPDRRYYFSAETANERTEWVDILRNLITGN